MPGTLKRLSIATAVAAAVGAATLPSAASAGPVEDLVGGVQKTVNDTLNSVGGLLGGGGGGGGQPAPAPAPQGGIPPEYIPPAHGTNPHGQGTVGVVDLTPEAGEPLPYDIDGGSEDIVVGRARGEQVGDQYHGHITILSTFLTGEIVGVDTDEGETEAGPLEPVQEAILDALCDGSDDQLCLQVLAADSETTEDGSTNRFAVADVAVGGPTGITATAAESNGNISDDGECQTSRGDSTVANASLGGAITADAAEADSNSTACNDGSETQENGGFALIAVNGDVVPVPPGCESGEPNTVFDIALVSVVCNADDSSSTGGVQNFSPYGVREAASVFLLPLLGDVAKVTTAAGESHAVAPGDDGGDCPDPTNPDCPPIDECPDPDNPDCPPVDECPDPDNPDCPDGPDECPDPDNPDCPDTTVSSGGPDGPGGPSADDDGGDDLAFTGADVGTLGAIGLGVMALGLALMAASDRRRRTTA